ncbi:MAG: Gfo/Idh/MocA family oxidoreductase [Phaeodactylibacter sp.]|nr:Gfo/Idh/MocA family oxidoreductase [Phaeodactylibacter sp.]MCB9295752.1 Gfo/Idh/MocA family oxidoreductase [Lewinellaceae bacterium]
MKRRRFLRQASTAAAGMGLAGMLPVDLIAANRKKISPNEKLGVAVIGCKGMGWTNMKRHFMVDGVECVALCDVDRGVMEERTAEAKKIQGYAPRNYGDYRKLLENKDVDAVIIGTPDHWHCLMMVDAVQAGKHVYVEKPIANSIKECRIMMAAGRKSGKVVQVGQWQRSGGHYEDAIAYVRSGKLGKIRLVKTWAYQGWMKPVPVLPDSAPPEGVDYAMWLGPAPKRPFNPNRFHFNFRWFWDYAGGLMTDWGVHEIDIALYAMQAKAPKSVMASGGKLAYPDDASETPDTLQAIFEYEDFTMLWEHAIGIDNGNYGRTEGIAFIGNHATLVVNRQGWEVIPETQNEDGMKKYEVEAIPRQDIGRDADYVKDHAQNFVDAIRANDPGMLKCGIETGGIAAINAQMGNIAYKTGRKIHWDDRMGLFKDDKEASALIATEYHNGWALPKL